MGRNHKREGRSAPTVKQQLAGVRMLFDWLVICMLLYTFARIEAVAGMRVEDFYPVGKRWWVRLHEKGGKE